MPRLDRLAGELDVLALDGDATVEVTGATHDSRQAGPGSLFCCVPGSHHDGHDHAPEAVDRGARALLCQRPLDLGVPELRVADVRSAMGPAAAAVHGHPDRSLDLVGVTGTNGKTTTTWLLQAVLEAAGRPTGLIGTLSHGSLAGSLGAHGSVAGGPRTTPEATDLQARLAELRDGGARAVAMEVSSHALALRRVDGMRFAVAVFTNLGRDHLDFHDSIEDYFAVKARLFDPERSAVGVVNLDDPHGRLLRDAARIPTRGWSLDEITDLEVGVRSSHGTWRGRRLTVPLGGMFNVCNALAAATTAVELGIDEATVVDGLAAAPPVPGRFEVVALEAPFCVVVDFAHTPEALEALLVTAREVTGDGGRVLAVFGAGGDKDQGKRPLMGEVASRHADHVVLTSDNPRTEPPADIAAAIRAGATGPGAVTTELDRRAAIASALAEARSGDLVVVAGKGHEAEQVGGEGSVPFDDREVVIEEWDRLGGGSGR
ncbi:MAG: UDP-N-acetylmuramoyl-L-alanyl-D-glutamate--2,6-diaminopimelate ligase [Acidimicrobiia bacterium]|nr:UDP-N-acetylmuramoyl-L-alanyl-D-glutamate--2,6-diaminopimelate ligase [Acidimicrobiia bacterium]